MKKITKFLDSVMGGIKRTCVAKALAVFAVASIAINVNAQTGVITGVDKLVGEAETNLKKIDFTDDAHLTFPTEIDKHYFLYNVKTGRFLNVGGYWGTHASLKEYGEPLAIVEGDQKDDKNSGKTYIKLVMEMNGTEGKFVGWVGVPNKNDPDVGVFVDRKSTDVIGWQLELVDATKNTYRLYTYAHKRFDDQKIELNFDKKYYLCSNMGSVDVDVNCGAFSEDDIAQYRDKGYDEWRFLSYQQIHNLQSENADALDDALELSFKLKCPGFSRGDNDIKSWNTYNYAIEYKKFGNWVVSDPKNDKDTEFARYGLQYYYNNKIAGPNTENKFTGGTLPSGGYTFDGKTYTGLDKDFHRNLSKYYCASITNKRGVLYQDVVVKTSGRYQIECKGYSTTKKASLFAGVLNSDKTAMIGKAEKITLNQVSNMSQDAQKELHVSEKNVDYAGKNFYGSRQYINSVYVTVPADVINKDGEATIRFGIMVGDDQNDKTPVTTDEGEWTVFDDFRILYAAKDLEEDLILDENREDLSYLVNCPTLMVNKTLHLNKSFTLDKWNSFILPVNLNKTQVLETFGANARLAELTRLTDTGIEFTSVNLLDDYSKPAIKAYVPYIIFPRKLAKQTETYTATYKQKGGKGQKLSINIPANHYVIGKVSMPSTELSKMDQTKWTLKDPVGNNGITANGTFARTFGKFNDYNETTGEYDYVTVKDMTDPIISGRPRLEHSYFFDKGNMYHSNGRARGLRGFSCWFETTGAQKSLKFTLDGVTQSGTTGIEDILADYEQPVSRFANGIYNLNGQLVKQGNSTAGLPSGMYIVNGKKCIVR